MRSLKTFQITLLFVLSWSGILFAGGQKDNMELAAKERTLTMMHDKGGVPNFQPFYEEAAAKVEESSGVVFTVCDSIGVSLRHSVNR